MTTPSHTAARERLNEAFNLYGPEGKASVDCADLRLLLDRLDALEEQNATLAERNATLVGGRGAALSRRL